MTEEPEVHPIQLYGGQTGAAPVVVTMRAYEVYKAIYREQAALVTGNCRGGFGAGELIAFLYARSFPRQEWPERVEEALRGLKMDPRR